ncbi:MAG: Gfo/Idh/MocA family oxidoreductase [Salegentibacter sp.]
MNKKTLRAGIVGSGFAAGFHLDALQRVFSANVEVVGVYSRNAENRNNFAQSHGIMAFDSLEELIIASDVVHICTPPVTHEAVVISALEKDRHVIVEKPLTGYFGEDMPDFNGDTFPRETGLEKAMEGVNRMLEAEKKSKGVIMYAENLEKEELKWRYLLCVSSNWFSNTI